METRFLLGPAGSGKTFRCLQEIRSALAASPEGLPLILLAPKQATFQLERQLLADPTLPGYTRLHILSFERLAEFVFNRLEKALPELLGEEGRVMVLRALLGQKREELRLFRASARLPGFAQQLSLALRELQHHQIAPKRLAQLAEEPMLPPALKEKLRDLALLYRAYLDWLAIRHLDDADALLELAASALQSAPARQRRSMFSVAGLWLDGFAQMTPQERHLLAAIVPFCQQATLAFCLDSEEASNHVWHSPWAVVQQTYLQCRNTLQALTETKVEVIKREAASGRFAGQPALQHLERFWSHPRPFPSANERASVRGDAIGESSPERAVRVVACVNAEAEAIFAAREIVRSVREEKIRFRDVAVLVRELESYHDPLRRVFSRYSIPFFLDRRQPVAHHPLAELTRSALRTITFGWRHDDWFGALKCGLMSASDEEIDWLENEALARGWKGLAWQTELKFDGDHAAAKNLEALRQGLVAPFNELARMLKDSPSGRQLADAIRQLWDRLNVGRQLEGWGRSEFPDHNSELPTTVHGTVWEQMQEWLDHLTLAFIEASMPLAEWLPIVETGLSSLSIGVVPPVLDQVLIGSIDRSRNPDLKRVFVLGGNETVFPARPVAPNLLSGADRKHLEQNGCALGPDARQQSGQENFYGYIACTRARERLTLTYAAYDAKGRKLNPSAFVGHLQRLFPSLQVEHVASDDALSRCEHPSEVIAPLLRFGRADRAADIPLAGLRALPSVASVLHRLQEVSVVGGQESLSPRLAEQLYGPVLRTSVSRLEQFAACPFRFFVNSGLQAEERIKFEVDARERGSFQHEVLARFHQQVCAANREWRDLTPAEARQLVARIAQEVAGAFRQGLFESSDQSLFTARSLTAALEDFIEVIVGWMKHSSFNPRAVELAFGGANDPLPAWELDLGDGHRMAFRGKIDRVDVAQPAGSNEGLCVVIDYKSRTRKIDPILLAHGLQLQLTAYLAAVRRLEAMRGILGVPELVPAGVFYVNLYGSYQGGSNRSDVLEDASEASLRAYRHAGRFSVTALGHLDHGYEQKPSGQFNYKLTKQNLPDRRYLDLLEAEEFNALLDRVEEQLRTMGRAIFGGRANLDPYRRGSETACDRCDYRSICRIDPWTHPYRTLRKAGPNT